jgi:hypothetical protein
MNARISALKRESLSDMRKSIAPLHAFVWPNDALLVSQTRDSNASFANTDNRQITCGQHIGNLRCRQGKIMPQAWAAGVERLD